ncbi:MAG: serine hydrolase domain-containing protein [Pseudomonadota bacterium]
MTAIDNNSDGLSQLGFSAARVDRLRAWLDHQVSSERYAGVSLLLGRYGKRAFFHAAGYADAERKRPFEEATLARIYSMTKPVTSVAAMMLYEENCFQLDDPVEHYLPEFRDMHVWRGGNAGIDDTVPANAPPTVRQIMTHTAGLTYGFMRANVVDEAYRDADLEFPGAHGSLAENVERLAALPLLCQPGQGWNYSVSTDVLGRLVEIWSGQSLNQFFDERIFKPLGMMDTGFSVSPGEEARFAACYAPKSGKTLGGIGQRASVTKPDDVLGYRLQDDPQTSPFLNAPSLYSGGGGLISTAPDYERFCRCLLNGGELDGVRLLGPRTLRYMRTNQLPDNRDMAAMGQPVWSETSYEGIGFGLGFAVVLDPVSAAFITSVGEHHWGGAASTFFWLDPEEDLYAVFLAQLIPSSAYPVRRELRSLVYASLIN